MAFSMCFRLIQIILSSHSQEIISSAYFFRQWTIRCPQLLPLEWEVIFWPHSWEWFILFAYLCPYTIFFVESFILSLNCLNSIFIRPLDILPKQLKFVTWYWCERESQEWIYFCDWPGVEGTHLADLEQLNVVSHEKNLTKGHRDKRIGLSFGSILITFEQFDSKAFKNCVNQRRWRAKSTWFLKAAYFRAKRIPCSLTLVIFWLLWTCQGCWLVST